MRTREQSIETFCRALAGGSATPGGGAAAAVMAAMGAALVGMVANHTCGQARYAAVHSEMAAAASRSSALMDSLLRLADQDRDAFAEVLSALALPGGDPAEQAAREKALESGFVQASLPPLAVMHLCTAVLAQAHLILARGNRHCQSEGVGAVAAARAAWELASRSVDYNLMRLQDPGMQQVLMEHSARLHARRQEIDDQIALLTQNETGAPA